MSDIWDNDHRKLTWFIMVRMRFGTNTEVNPTISNAYVYLQKYFNSNPTVEYDLYIIVISALLVAFKNDDLKCDINSLLAIFLRVCQEFTKIYLPDEIISIFNCNSLDDRSISVFEESKVNDCEMDLLEALNYETHVDLPFYYLNTCLFQYISNTDPSKFFMDPQTYQEIVKNFEINAIKFFSAEEYLELPVPVIAAISLFGAIKGRDVPQETVKWLEDTKREYGQEACSRVLSVFKRQNQFLNLSSKLKET